MTQDEIIEMANQAGIVNPQMVINTLEAFAKLVAQHEREACAKQLDALGCDHCATAIRSRDKQDGECKYCTDGCPACDARKLPKQEPVAWFSTLPDGRLSIKIVGKPTEGNWEPLYTTPPQRTWVGLTGEEVKNFVQAVWPREATPTDYIRAIEAKLKEKNT